MVSGFGTAIALHLGFSIASGCFSIYTMFARNSQEAIDKCTEKAGDESDATVQSCKKALILFKAIVVTVYVLMWLIQLCKFFSITP